jgi:ankyrin repeat protein
MPIEGHQTMAKASRKGTVADLERAIVSLRNVADPRDHAEPNYPLNTAIAKDQQTALHLASHHGNLEVIKYLIEQGANIDITDAHGNTPAHRAAIHHKDAALQLLYERGANRSIENKVGLKPESAGFPVGPHQAISNHNSQLLNTLLTPSHQLYPRRDDADNDGNTLLHHAVIKESKDCVDVLIKRKVNPLLENKMGTTPGVLAARRGSIEIAQQLHPCFLAANRR